jgi:hypothetical protein
MHMQMHEYDREERRKAAARERGRLLKLASFAAISIDEERQLFGSRRYPQKLD